MGAWQQAGCVAALLLVLPQLCAKPSARPVRPIVELLFRTLLFSSLFSLSFWLWVRAAPSCLKAGAAHCAVVSVPVAQQLQSPRCEEDGKPCFPPVEKKGFLFEQRTP